MLIRDAEIDGTRCDVRISGQHIALVANGLVPLQDELVIEARGGALLPGLHDHHIHLNALAAAMTAVRCGPPDIEDARQLAAALQDAKGVGWMRGIGYHASIGIVLDRAWLDRHGPARPIRVQHRSGRMWILNSLAAEAIGEGVPEDGILIDRDEWLAARLSHRAPDLAPLGVLLAKKGITGLTEATARNGLADYHRYVQSGLQQRMTIMGSAELDGALSERSGCVGAVKLHYHDHDLPALDSLVEEVVRAHRQGRAIASHCVTSAELMLTLAAVETAGSIAGDRIEHAAMVIPETAEWIARLGLTVVTQPHFLSERGAAYKMDVPADDLQWLYRLRGLCALGIPLAAGSDAPFGAPDPWRSMAAAVDRPDGFGNDEAISPEAALALYGGNGAAPGGISTRIAEGELADLCLIDRPWSIARDDLAAVTVQATIINGRPVYRHEG